MLIPPIYRAAYSDRMAWVLASMAHIAYDRFENCEKEGATDEDKKIYADFVTKLASGGFKLVRTFNNDKTDTQAFLARTISKEHEYAVLAFRGTEVSKQKDILTDLRASKLENVHGGFKGAYESVEEEIKESLFGLTGIPLYITGHSLGAALATVATRSLETDEKYGAQFKQMIAACYTFGSPRVGTSRYDFRSPIYRVVNTTDIVTAIPLLAMGYVHIGDVRFLGVKDGEYQRGIPILRRLLLFLFTAIKFFGPIVGDHAIVEYRRKLGNIAEKRNPSVPDEVIRHHMNLVK
jgi:hypothetical protein